MKVVLMNASKTQRALQVIRENGVLRPRDLIPHGIPRHTLRTLRDRGVIERVGRGLYVLADTTITEHHSLAEASKRVPRGVICLLSALSFHGLTTQNPSQVWMAVDRKGWSPNLDLPFVRLVRFSGPALAHGVELHNIEGVEVKIYSPAKTVADSFKYRNKIGLDVAMEALRDCLRQRKATVDQLLEAAEVCRVARVMRPYLESLT